MNNNLTKGFMGFFLITTEEESTWEFDLPILFIGSHCLNYDRKNTWEKLNYQLNPPLCKGQEEKNQALQITRKQVNELLSELTIKMNLIHGVNHRERYWNIFIGYWVRLFVDVLYNRYFTIELALSNFEINKTIFFKNENELVASDSTEFINLCNDNVWNNILYSKILKFREVSLEFEEIASFQTTDFQGILSSSTKKFSIKKFLINLYSKISPLLCRDSDAFIIESYLPGIDELKLQLALGQWPQVWNIPRPTKTSIDHKIRAQLKFDLQNRTGFEKFIRMLLPEMIPTCYLEGYGNLLRQISELPYPKYPKFIFTSNCFERYEVFNLWTAEKTEKNIKYFIGQHGNNYGTHFSSGPEICAKEKSADKFFSWGWEAPEFNVVSAFNFKITNRSPRSYNPRGGLILVEVCYFPYLSAWDVSYDYSLYQEEIFKFVELLSPNIHEKLIVRLHGAYKLLKWCDDSRWKDRSPKTKLDSGKNKIKDLISENRLIVHGYDSTGILETMALNIPTMCYWQYGFDHLVPEAKTDYELLKEAGIFAESPAQLAQFINQNWEHIDEWWFSEKVQAARETFCNKYSKVERNPTSKLSYLFKKTLNELSD